MVTMQNNEIVERGENEKRKAKHMEGLQERSTDARIIDTSHPTNCFCLKVWMAINAKLSSEARLS